MRLPFPDTPEPGRAVEGSEIDRITVADLMQREVITISPGARLRDLAELLSYHQIGGVPVVGASGTVLGVVTTRDIVTMTARLPGPDPVRASVPGPEKSEYFASVRATPQLLRRLVTAGMEERRVSEIMTSATFTVPENANLRELAALLWEAGVHRALVMKAGRLSGIVTTMDVMRAVAGQVARPEPRSVEMPLPEVDPGPRP